MDRLDKMDVLYLVTDFLCKKKLEENENDFYNPHYALVAVTTLSTLTIMYNFYSYFKLNRKYEDLKKKAGLDETIKNVYNNLVDITESESDSEEDSDNEENGSIDEYNLEDVDLKK